MKKTLRISAAISTLALVTPTAALAHAGHHGGHGLIEGFMHTLTGMDHFLMALCLGFLSRNVTKSVMPMIAAIIAMAIGFGSGLMLGFSAPVEFLIAASLIVVAGGLWTVAEAKQMIAKATLVSCVGLIFFHGYAHGVESGSETMGFAVGMLVCASAIMGAGYKLQEFVGANRWLSAGVASIGTFMMFS